MHRRWPVALSTLSFTFNSPSSRSHSLKPFPSQRFLPISSHAGLWNFLSSKCSHLASSLHFLILRSSLTVSCTALLNHYEPSPGFNSSWSLRRLPLILWQTSVPAGQIHTDVISHWSGALSAFWISWCNICAAVHRPLSASASGRLMMRSVTTTKWGFDNAVSPNIVTLWFEWNKAKCRCSNRMIHKKNNWFPFLNLLI